MRGNKGCSEGVGDCTCFVDDTFSWGIASISHVPQIVKGSAHPSRQGSSIANVALPLKSVNCLLFLQDSMMLSKPNKTPIKNTRLYNFSNLD
jgi:hypothetical protein